MILHIQTRIPESKILGISIFWSMAIIVLVLGYADQTMAQQPTGRISLSIEKLKAIYDMSFPRATNAFDATKDEFSMDIMIDPSFRGPVQVSIVKRHDGTVLVNRYTLSNSSVSLSDQVSSMIERGAPDDVAELSRRLNVIRHQISDARKLKPIILGFFSRTRFPPSKEITLDGVGYEVWYTDSASEAYFSHVGGEQFTRGELPIITWARTLVEKSSKLIGSNTDLEETVRNFV